MRERLETIVRLDWGMSGDDMVGPRTVCDIVRAFNTHTHTHTIHTYNIDTYKNTKQKQDSIPKNIKSKNKMKI